MLLMHQQLMNKPDKTIDTFELYQRYNIQIFMLITV